jgi:hypothetical protein
MGDHRLIFDIVDQDRELPRSADGKRSTMPVIIRKIRQVCSAVHGESKKICRERSPYAARNRPAASPLDMG